MPAVRRVALTAAAVVIAVGTGGCGQAAPSAGSSSAALTSSVATTITPGPHVCLDRAEPEEQLSPEAAAQARPALAAGDVAGFVMCDVVTERVAGHGEWTVRRERRADAGTSALAAALRLPDLPPLTSGSCTALGQLVPEVYALDDKGHAVLVRWPLDECGHLRKEVLAAADGVHWTEVASRRLRQITPQGALDSGCAADWKDMPAIEGADAAARHGRGTLDTMAKATSVHACTYRITERGDVPVGSFEAGRTLDAAAWQAVLQTLESAPAASDGCTIPGQRFTVLSDAASRSLYVELDGCRRVLTPDSGLRLATPQLLQNLARS